MGHRTFVQQKMGHERKKVENHCSRGNGESSDESV